MYIQGPNKMTRFNVNLMINTKFLPILFASQPCNWPSSSYGKIYATFLLCHAICKNIREGC